MSGKRFKQAFKLSRNGKYCSSQRCELPPYCSFTPRRSDPRIPTFLGEEMDDFGTNAIENMLFDSQVIYNVF